MTTKDGLIVLSGGMDSVTLLYEYQDSLALAVSFDYGSKHNARELPYARLHCERLGIEHLTIPLSFIGQYFRSALLEGEELSPRGATTRRTWRPPSSPSAMGSCSPSPLGSLRAEDSRRSI